MPNRSLTKPVLITCAGALVFAAVLVRLPAARSSLNFTIASGTQEMALQQSFDTKYQLALQWASSGKQPLSVNVVHLVQVSDPLQVIASHEPYIWPVVGSILPSAIDRNSLDINAPIGTVVVAAQSGTVITAGEKYNGYGQMVEVSHPDGAITRYAHGSQIFVQQGQAVKQGQAIMSVGASGLASNPHVRFEILVAGQSIDPLTVLP